MHQQSCFCIQPVPASYGMFVDKHGNLGNHVVMERAGRAGPVRRPDVLLKPLDASDAEKERMDLKRDILFKMFLGDEQYKEEVAIPFHRAFWGHRIPIGDLDLKTAPIKGNTADARNIDADIVWQTPDTGAVFLTEMQRDRQDCYSDRLSLYESKVRATIAPKGSRWDFCQPPVFVLGMADFNLHRAGAGDYLHEYASINIRDSRDMFTGKDWKMLADLEKAR